MVLCFLLIIAELRCSGSSQKELAMPQARERKIRVDDSLCVLNRYASPCGGCGRKRACHWTSYLFNSRVSGPMLADRNSG